MEVRLYVLNAGIPIPTVLCLVLGDGKDWPGATVALAAHLSPHIAARKAVLEQGMIGPSIRRQMLDRKCPIPRRPAEVHRPMDHALYYIPRERAAAFDFLRSGRESILLADLGERPRASLASCLERLAEGGLRVAVKDLTSPDVAACSPFHVVRALSPFMQPIHFGFNLGRLANPRLKGMMRGRLNPDPHPLA
jgi:ribosomal protein S12 methylthiotransferase accessory factor